eukprot:2742819-Alexandrium_andersonii.AAC.1
MQRCGCSAPVSFLGAASGVGSSRASCTMTGGFARRRVVPGCTDRPRGAMSGGTAVSYTHLRAHETSAHL